jgi:hypothetical protein
MTAAAESLFKKVINAFAALTSFALLLIPAPKPVQDCNSDGNRCILKRCIATRTPVACSSGLSRRLLCKVFSALHPDIRELQNINQAEDQRGDLHERERQLLVGMLETVRQIKRMARGCI